MSAPPRSFRWPSWRQIAVAVLVGAMTAWSAQRWGWPGVALVASGVVMWLLLNVTRMMTVFKRAADRPIGHVASAVMLNAKLKAGQPLLHVIALTRALGEPLSEPEAEPQVLRWTDAGGVSVTATFTGGRLSAWQLARPDAPDTAVAAAD